MTYVVTHHQFTGSGWFTGCKCSRRLHFLSTWQTIWETWYNNIIDYSLNDRAWLSLILFLVMQILCSRCHLACLILQHHWVSIAYVTLWLWKNLTEPSLSRVFLLSPEYWHELLGMTVVSQSRDRASLTFSEKQVAIIALFITTIIIIIPQPN